MSTLSFRSQEHDISGKADYRLHKNELKVVIYVNSLKQTSKGEKLSLDNKVGGYNTLSVGVREIDERDREEIEKLVTRTAIVGLLKYIERVQSSQTLESSDRREIIWLNQSDIIPKPQESCPPQTSIGGFYPAQAGSIILSQNMMDLARGRQTLPRKNSIKNIYSQLRGWDKSSGGEGAFFKQ